MPQTEGLQIGVVVGVRLHTINIDVANGKIHVANRLEILTQQIQKAKDNRLKQPKTRA